MPSELLVRLLNSKISPKVREKSLVVKTPKDQRPYRQKADHIAYDFDFSSKEVLIFKPNPKVVVKKRVEDFVNMTEFSAYLRLFYSKNPHLKFVKIHQSSLSDSVKQILFYDERKKVTIAMNFKEFMENGKHKTFGAVNLGLKSFDKTSESLDN